MRRFFNRDVTFIVVVLVVSAGLLWFPGLGDSNKVMVSARIITLDDSTELKAGWIKVGRQELSASVLNGDFKGQNIAAENSLQGNFLVDRYVEVGDRAIFSLEIEKGKIKKAELVDFDRQRWHLILFILLSLLLILFARFTGVKAFASFIFTIVFLVRVLIPAILAGYDPLFLCVSTAVLIGSVTLLLVGGFSIRTLAAIFGVTIGMLLTVVLTIMAGTGLRLDGISGDHSLLLRFSGFPNLNLDRVLWGAIILGASGAMVDIAIAVSTAVEQVVKANPSLSARRLIQSGFEVGRAALGTMVTSLLLAYAGCSIFLLLLFSSKETHLARILNYNVVSAEILRTLAGSIGMVMVAPLTAIIAGLLYRRIYGPGTPPLVVESLSNSLESDGTD